VQRRMASKESTVCIPVVQGLRVAFPTRKRSLWYTTKSRFFLLVVFVNLQKLSLKCLWDGSGVGCNVAQPNSPQNVLADGPRARQYTLDASEDGAALLSKCSRVKGRRCPAFRDTFIQPMEADLDQTTFLTQG